MKKTLFPSSDWQSKLFKAIALLFLAVFVVFILALILADIFYIDREATMTALTAPFVRQALWISIWTSCTATALSLLFAIPIGYALGRLIMWALEREFHASFSYTFPLWTVLAALAVTVLVSLVVLRLPLRRAVQMQPGMALRYE